MEKVVTVDVGVETETESCYLSFTAKRIVDGNATRNEMKLKKICLRQIITGCHPSQAEKGGKF